MNAPFNHPTYRSLAASILADPGEDTHRLALADWLDEEGHGRRAEFVRVQVELGIRHPCEFSKIDTCFDRRGDATEVGWSGCKLCRRRVPRVKELKARERALWNGAVGDKSIFHTWFDAPDGWDVGVSGQTVTFRTTHSDLWSGACRVNRGFVESVSCGGDWWVNHGDALAAHHPVRKVHVHTKPSEGWSVPIGPDDQSAEADFVVAGRGVTVPRGKGPRSLFQARWPGVAFDLPLAPWWNDSATDRPPVDVTMSEPTSPQTAPID